MPCLLSENNEYPKETSVQASRVGEVCAGVSKIVIQIGIAKQAYRIFAIAERNKHLNIE